MKEKPVKNEICVCGHPTEKHELYGTPYARCRDFTSRTKCNCNMAARPVAKLVTGKIARFKRTARGTDRPHALLGAISAAAEKDSATIEWLVTDCDNCGQSFDEDPHVYVLDGNGGIQRPGKPFPLGSPLGKDTGKHVMLCAKCDVADQNLTGYWE